KPVTSNELFPAVAFGVDGIEHLVGASRRGYTPKQSAAARAYRDVIDLIARSGATVTPTIGLQGAYRARIAGDASLLYDPRLALLQALQTATVNAAQTLGIGDELGTIEIGKVADLAFIGGDPLLDIRNTRDVKRVMKGGRVYTVEDLLRR